MVSTDLDLARGCLPAKPAGQIGVLSAATSIDWRFPSRNRRSTTIDHPKTGGAAAVAETPGGGEDLSPEALAAVQAHYTFRQPDAVTAYLRRYPYLGPTLLEATKRIPRYFGDDPRLALEILKDPEEYDPIPELFAMVRIAFGPKEAMERLDRFDADCWTMAAPNGPAVLVVSVEFRSDV